MGQSDDDDFDDDYHVDDDIDDDDDSYDGPIGYDGVDDDDVTSMQSNRLSRVDKAPRLSIRIDIWILLSDTVFVKLNQINTNSETAMQLLNWHFHQPSIKLSKQQSVICKGWQRSDSGLIIRLVILRRC